MGNNQKYDVREFNRLNIDTIYGTITKSSNKKQKLLDEVNWYKSLPKELVCFVPRVFDVKENADSVDVKMELYDYPNLAGLFVRTYSDFEYWKLIITRLMKIQKIMSKYTIAVDKSELRAIYETKTKERLEDIKNKNIEIYEMMKPDIITINGVDYKNINIIENDIFKMIKNLINFDKLTIVHGDYCFSNILHSDESHIFRFVDPRGRFKNQSIYGDPRYDIAKLRHSFIGLYDFIMSNLFDLDCIGDNKYNLVIRVSGNNIEYEKFFDDLISEYGYNPKDIKLIESLLFLTMIPLHSDKTNHQKVFYLTAIKKLNEVLYGK